MYEQTSALAKLNNVSNPIRFQGQYFDEESGLHYNRFRYYDPETGRYLSEDPIKLAGGMSLYGYPVNPIQWVDPFGLAAADYAYGGPGLPNPPGESTCQRLSREIDEMVNRNKRLDLGRGTHGLKHRFAEQSAKGATGPGDPSGVWERHDTQIKKDQKGLRSRIKLFKKYGCGKGGDGGDPIPVDAEEWANKPAPTAGDWNKNNSVEFYYDENTGVFVPPSGIFGSTPVPGRAPIPVRVPIFVP